MFIQFFGNYLLEKRYINAEQLLVAMEEKCKVKLKLGVLAINTGYMTAAQVDKVHHMQKRIDKRFGNLAVEMGYLEDYQVTELLKAQKTGYLVLGQALVNLGYLDMKKFEKALDEYKNLYNINFDNFANIQSNKMVEIVKDFYKFHSSDNAMIYTKYISLLFRNLIRFVGDDFTPLRARQMDEFSVNNMATQIIDGDYNIFTGIEGNEESLKNLAKRVDHYDSGEFDEYVKASVSEFLNLCNGIFCVNLSNVNDINLEMEPQKIFAQANFSQMKEAYILPVKFTFGVINFLLVGNEPKIIG